MYAYIEILIYDHSKNNKTIEINLAWHRIKMKSWFKSIGQSIKKRDFV